MSSESKKIVLVLVQGTQTVSALIASISSGPNFLSSAINGFRNTTTNVSVQGLTQNITISTKRRIEKVLER